MRMLFPSVVLGLVAAATVHAAVEPIVVLEAGRRREVLPVTRGASEMMALETVLPGLGVATHTDVTASSVTLAAEGREVVLYHNKSLASVAGELRLLSAPCLFEEGSWLVPVDAVPRLLGFVLGKTVEWRPASRALLIGNVRIPRIEVTAYVAGESVRLILSASEKVPFRVRQGEGRVMVAIERDIIEVKLDQERLTGGIVDALDYTPGREGTIGIALGKRFHQLKAAEQEQPPRLVLEFLAAPQAASASGATAPTASAPPLKTPAPVEHPAHSIVIDAGHGGAEVGAQGTDGTLEKDVTLAIARKLRSAIVTGLGYQVFMTRDKDEEVPLDQRTAIANNFKADVFVSIHANASRAAGAHGSEVFFLAYQASDENAHRLALAEGGAVPVGASSLEPGSDLALILWDMAQAEHLEESSSLAARVQEELAEVTGSGSRGVKQAPFRVLVGATMPAVLVEVAFLSNPEEEKLLTSDAFQSRVASAIMRGMSRYFQNGSRREAVRSRER
jgi:N-acetylmuramoyl-L-alanine amidase